MLLLQNGYEFIHVYTLVGWGIGWLVQMAINLLEMRMIKQPYTNGINSFQIWVKNLDSLVWEWDILWDDIWQRFHWLDEHKLQPEADKHFWELSVLVLQIQWPIGSPCSYAPTKPAQTQGNVPVILNAESWSLKQNKCIISHDSFGCFQKGYPKVSSLP